MDKQTQQLWDLIFGLTEEADTESVVTDISDPDLSAIKSGTTEMNELNQEAQELKRRVVQMEKTQQQSLIKPFLAKPITTTVSADPVSQPAIPDDSSKKGIATSGDAKTVQHDKEKKKCAKKTPIPSRAPVKRSPNTTRVTHKQGNKRSKRSHVYDSDSDSSTGSESESSTSSFSSETSHSTDFSTTKKGAKKVATVRPQKGKKPIPIVDFRGERQKQQRKMARARITTLKSRMDSLKPLTIDGGKVKQIEGGLEKSEIECKPAHALVTFNSSNEPIRISLYF